MSLSRNHFNIAVDVEGGGESQWKHCNRVLQFSPLSLIDVCSLIKGTMAALLDFFLGKPITVTS